MLLILKTLLFGTTKNGYNYDSNNNNTNNNDKTI